MTNRTQTAMLSSHNTKDAILAKQEVNSTTNRIAGKKQRTIEYVPSMS